jgi:hypothetical protein
MPCSPVVVRVFLIVWVLWGACSRAPQWWCDCVRTDATTREEFSFTHCGEATAAEMAESVEEAAPQCRPDQESDSGNAETECTCVCKKWHNGCNLP